MFAPIVGLVLLGQELDVLPGDRLVHQTCHNLTATGRGVQFHVVPMLTVRVNCADRGREMLGEGAVIESFRRNSIVLGDCIVEHEME